jgi:hypothetical protein
MIERIDANGSWSTVTNGGIIYRTAAGAVVSWWKSPARSLFKVLMVPGAQCVLLSLRPSTADEAGSAATNSPPEQPWHTFEMIVKVRRSN